MCQDYALAEDRVRFTPGNSGVILPHKHQATRKKVAQTKRQDYYSSRRRTTYSYDAQGRAIETTQPDGVNYFHATWATPPGQIITDTFDNTANVVWRDHWWGQPGGAQVQGPLGSSTTLGSLVVSGFPVQTTRDQPGGSGCGAGSSQQGYDTRGNVVSKLDFGEQGENRHRTCYAYDASRNVETYRVEGLLETDACPPDLATYTVPGNLGADKPQRKITTQWHPLWKLEARKAEPKRITTTIYNGEKDPPVTGATVTCVDTDPKLPDNSRIAVVCRRYEQATADETGSQGFSATPLSTRTWNYDYDQYGQVRTETDPRGKQTKYEYYGATLFDGMGSEHTMGDLSKVTRAWGTLNQATEYQHYNKRGQPLRIKHPNGTLELREYHVRGWLTKVTLRPADVAQGNTSRDQVTLYDYYPTGLLHTVTQPDGGVTTYTWDAAHRLTDVTDSAGNSVHYDMDHAGNRTAEQYKDPSGTLAKTITRVFDVLGRMSSQTGAP